MTFESMVIKARRLQESKRAMVESALSTHWAHGADYSSPSFKLEIATIKLELHMAEFPKFYQFSTK